jgi:hypothetical protein
LGVDAFEAYASVLRDVAATVPGYRRVPLSPSGDPDAGVLILSRFGLPSLDRVLLPRLTRVPAQDALVRVEGEARAAGTAVNWWLDPGARPESLKQLLADRGYEHTRDYPVMSRDLEDLPAPESPPGVELGWAIGAATVRESQIVSGTAFGRPPAAVEAMADALSSPDVVGNPCVAIATASVAGQMVGSGTLWITGGIAGILNVGTLEQARGRGIGYAITLASLRRAMELGATLAALHASTQGFPIYLRMGFRHDGNVRVFRGPADLR